MILVGEALYGERNRGHALLGASPAAGAVAAAIVGRMDLAGTQPPGTSWLPYVSGFREGDHYIVARTMPDNGAQRAGMVFSRAFILPLVDAERLDDIGGLFARLADQGAQRDDPLDFAWDAPVATAAASKALAEALLADGEGPVIWPGQAGFEEAIAGLWRRLWPVARANLSFGLAFRPQDLPANPPLIVATPHGLIGRWGGHRRAAEDPVSLGAAEALLAGEPEGEPLHHLMAELEAGIALADLRQLEDLHLSLAGTADLETLLLALRNAAFLSPDPGKGRGLKRALLDQAVEAIARAGPEAILMARNLDLSAHGAGAAFWKRLARWAETQLWGASDRNAAARVIHAGFSESGPLPEWRSAMKTGITAALAARRSDMIEGLWGIAAAAPEIFDIVLVRAPDPDALEAVLVDRAPRKLETSTGEAMMGGAVQIGRPRLHAAIAASAFAPGAAVDAHMAGIAYGSATLEVALRHASGKDRIDIALGRDVPELFAFAGDAAAQNPKLLAPLVIADGRWRAIWREALARNLDAWAGPKAPRAAADVLWTALAGGDSDALHLLRPLAATPLADISGHRARAALWDLIPADLKPRILAVTAEGAAAAFLAGNFDEGVEDILGSELAKPEHSASMLSALVDDPARGAALFRLLPKLEEPVFRAWCERVLARHSALPSPVAESFGRLIAARVWHQAASHFASLAGAFFSPRNDLRPALRNCLDLVGFFDRWYLGMTSAPASETRWKILEEVAIELYHSGPGHDELWSRAGGKNAKLPLQGNGAQKWRHVITQARSGKLDIRMGDLVRQMYVDYPANRALAKLHDEGLFRR